MRNLAYILRNDTIESIGQKCNLNFNRLANRTDNLTQDELDEIVDAINTSGIISDAIDDALSLTTTNVLSDVMTEDACTVTAINAMKWGNVASIRFSYRLNSSLSVPSNGDIADVTLGTLNVGWRPFDMTNVILDQSKIIIGDVGNDGVIKARSANARNSSYTIDVNAVLYASMTFLIGIQ